MGERMIAQAAAAERIGKLYCFGSGAPYPTMERR